MAKVLLSENDSDSSDSDVGGAEIGEEFKVNQQYADKFEYNKKREERARLEEKLGASRKRKRGGNEQDSESESESSSSSEDEDEVAELATAALDSEILATLNAIKSKDPRVYDASTTFYTETIDNGEAPKEKKEKPVYLRDYHRQNLLSGANVEEEEEEPLSYNQQQENLKRSIVSEMHAVADASDNDSDSEGGLLVRKAKREPSAKKMAEKLDVQNADRDPETFLSNFMAARAWVPLDQNEQHPFESDDESEDDRAEKFEEAYNMRFEAPEKSNETLRSYSREFAERYSARREEKNARKKKREAEKSAKAAAKQQLKEEKARLKKLKLEEAQEKIKRIKVAAGLKTTDLQPEDWARFIDDDWDDSKWEEEMQKRFGDQYYAQPDELSDQEVDEETSSKKKRKPHKPKFDDDIDIKDIIPDFVEEEPADFSLSETSDNDNDPSSQSKKLPKKSAKQSKIDSKHESRRERRILSALIDDQINLSLPTTSSKTAGFRYRETSPESFGLTPRDILLADDSALNSFAGLKKLATFREENKKAKDRKHLGKKARLRKWRLDTFGDEEGPTVDVNTDEKARRMNSRDDGSDEEMDGGVNIIEGGKKKKSRRRKKAKTATA